MNRPIRISLLSSVCLTLLRFQSFSETTVTKEQVVLKNLHSAIFRHQEEHDGNLPDSLDELASYVELDTLEGRLSLPLEEGIKLLTSGNWYSPTDGRCLLAIVMIPRKDGKYDVLYKPSEEFPESPRLGALSVAQLRGITLNPAGSDSTPGALQSHPSTSIERIEIAAPPDGAGKREIGANPNLADYLEIREPAPPKWTYVFVIATIAVIAIGVLALRARGRNAKC